MRIYWNITENGVTREVYRDVVIADSSYHFQEVMGDNNVVLNFSLVEYIDFPVGARIMFNGEWFTLLEIGNVTKINERQYDYTLTFESAQKELSRYKFRNMEDGRLAFTLTAQPQEFILHIVRNISARTGVEWHVGDCLVSAEKTQSFSHNSILDALNSVAQLFDTEWEINSQTRTINLRKVEYFKTSPLRLAYGKGNGFISGVSRQKGQETAVDVLWVEGGDRNIDSHSYTYQKTINGQVQTLHANKLRLPKGLQFFYLPPANDTEKGTLLVDTSTAEGRRLRDSGLYAEINGRYAHQAMIVYTDEDGFGVSRRQQDWVNNGYEDSVELTDIYPSKKLQVDIAELEGYYENDPEIYSNRFWNIYCKTEDGSPIPDYNAYMIGGQDVTIVFNTGMLAGKEFNLHNLGTEATPKCYDPVTKCVKIQPTAIDGIVMPDLPLKNRYKQDMRDKDGVYGTGYVPVVNDEFAIFHVALPQQYIDEAEKELLLNACQYLYKHSQVEVEFSGTVDGIWAKNKWEQIRSYFHLGGYIKFTDNALCRDGKDMRIISIKTYLTNPHAPEVTLSNSSVSQSISSELKKISQNQVYVKQKIYDSNLSQIRFSERSFFAVENTMSEMNDDLAKAKKRLDNDEYNIYNQDGSVNRGFTDINTSITNTNNKVNGINGTVNGLNASVKNLNGAMFNPDGTSKLEDAIAKSENDLAKQVADWTTKYTEGINPVYVHTMKTVIGDSDTQFEFGEATVNSDFLVTRWDEKPFPQPSWNKETKQLELRAAEFRHLTYTQSNTEGAKETLYPYWWVSAANLVSAYYWNDETKNWDNRPLEDGKKYYIYLRANKNATNNAALGHLNYASTSFGAEWVLFRDLPSHQMSNSHYYFLYGTMDCDHSVAPWYGFTEISGNQILTGIIRSRDGNTFFDLDHNLIGGRIQFKDGILTQDLELIGGTAGVGGANEDYAFWAGNNLMNNSYFRVLKNGRLEVRDNIDTPIFKADPDTRKVYIHGISFERIDATGSSPVNVWGKLVFKRDVTFDNDIKVNGKFVANSLTAIKEFIPIAGKFNHSGVLSIHGESVKSGYSFGRSAQGYYGLTINSTGDLRDCLCLATVNNVTQKKGNGSQMYTAACVYYKNGNTEIWFQVGDDASANDLNEDGINREVHFALLRCSKLWNL